MSAPGLPSTRRAAHPRRFGSLPLRRAAGAALLAAALALAGVGTAAAHVTVQASGAQQGGYGVLTFRVPNESSDAGTTGLTVTLPGLRSARTEPVPGWTATLEKDPESDLVTSVTWTADPGSQIGQGEFMQFPLLAGPLPESDSVSFPADQTYSDGDVVRWNQKTDDSGVEPEHPAPTLTLAASDAPAGASGPGSDNGSAGGSGPAQSAPGGDADDTTARWLGGTGLVLGALALALALGGAIGRSRSKP